MSSQPQALPGLLLHWVSAAHALDAEVRVYNRLFTQPLPEETDDGTDFLANSNPQSLEILSGCKIELFVKGAPAGSRYQFERQAISVSILTRRRKNGLQPHCGAERYLGQSQGESLRSP